ncbi:MAG: MotA/TolQ/ExbB proton channel family protein [Fibrobacterales bacterium]|nr:MotA/TolQ/ExbB proton channel family protein [Fibrobacterales bacterium]
MELSVVVEEVAGTLVRGGWVLVPLFAVGLAAWFFGILQWAALGGMLRDADGFAERLVAERKPASREACDDLLDEARAGWKARSGAHLRTVARLAAAAPLLGLLGTVTGMRESFRTIMVHGFGNPVLLADGISEALLTTQAGLVVAFPLVLLSAFLRNRAKLADREMEQAFVRRRNAMEATA